MTIRFGSSSGISLGALEADKAVEFNKEHAELVGIELDRKFEPVAISAVGDV